MSQTQEEKEENPLIQEKEGESYDGNDWKNLLNLLYFIEQCDVGLPRSEILILNLSIQKLILEVPIENVR